ncbi:prealbumin-like fold domain-containing protein [Bacillus cereus]|nr:prealbumin-like fold domain-containing protein [Bacillus cereus]
MNKTVKYAIRFLAVPFVTGAVLFSTVAPQHVQAASEPSLQTQKNEVGTLEITLAELQWKYDHNEPGGFKYSPGNKLADVEFTIYKHGKEYTKQKTDKDGKIHYTLPTGVYTYKQTSAAKNYIPEPREFRVTIKSDGHFTRNIFNTYSMYT